jgi:hypothetical protein
MVANSMLACAFRPLVLIVVCWLAITPANAQSIVRIGQLSVAGASPELKQAVEDKGYSVPLADGSTADFWFTRTLLDAGDNTSGALYPHLSSGEFVGVVNFTKGASDFRGQAIAPGAYTLRYQYIPQDANHMGVSPNPDFLLAIPVAADTAPTQKLAFQSLVKLSTKASNTAHPAVFALAPAGNPGSVTKDDQGMQVFTVEVPGPSSGKTEKIGIVIKGQASQ